MIRREPFARARNTDPSTSHAAAKAIEATGKAGRQRTQVLELVLAHPGMTAAELGETPAAKIHGLDRYAINRRLPELRDAELVCMGNRRPCTVIGSDCMPWWPNEKQGRLL